MGWIRLIRIARIRVNAMHGLHGSKTPNQDLVDGDKSPSQPRSHFILCIGLTRAVRTKTISVSQRDETGPKDEGIGKSAGGPLQVQWRGLMRIEQHHESREVGR